MDLEIITNLNLSGNFSLGDLNLDDSLNLLIHEIIITVVCAVGATADALTIYLIWTTKKLQGPVYTYILNWAFVDLLYLAITLCFYRMYAALESYTVTEEFFCVTIEFATILQIASIIFVAILCAVWFSKNFWPVETSYARYWATFVWTITIILITVFSMFCIHDIFYLASHFLAFFGYTILMHLIIIMHLIRLYRKYRNLKPYDAYPFITLLSTTYVLCSLPSWLCIMFLSFFKYMSVMAACISYMNSVVNILILYKCNSYFRMSFRKLFRCDRTGYIMAVDDNISDDSDVTTVTPVV